MLNLIDAAWWILLIVGIILLVGGWRGLQKKVHRENFYIDGMGMTGGEQAMSSNSVSEDALLWLC